MKSLPFFIAWRYFKGKKKEKNISTMVVICFFGIVIGAFALALIASVMNGFEKVTHEKMQSIHPEIIMHSDQQELNYKKIAQVLKKEFPEIQSFSPNTIKQIIVQSDTSDAYNIVILKGVDPKHEHTVCSIGKKIIRSINPLEKTILETIKNNKIVIGQKLANNLDVIPGDKINLFFSKSDKITRKRIRLKENSVIIGGIFKTGIQEFDEALIICSLDLLEAMFGSREITQISIQTKPGQNINNIVKKLRNRFSIQVYSWQELYPALVQALRLEKYVMFFILALIILVASMNIISLLFMQITQKRSDIAILKAMGLSDTKISRIFLYLGMTISFFGSILGLGLAIIASWALEKYPFIKLPDAYYVTHLPSKMEFSIIITVFLVVIVLSFLSTWIPTRRTRKINISEVLRFEG